MHPARTRRVCLLLVLALLGAGCATTIRARVLDAETRQPIPGAVVLGVWTKIVCPLSCVHELVGVRETETDGVGRFQLERLPSSGFDGEGDGQAITVYKFGYVAWSNLYLFPSYRQREKQGIPKDILLERFPPNESHRRHLDFIHNARSSVMYWLDSVPKFRDALLPEQKLRERERP